MDTLIPMDKRAEVKTAQILLLMVQDACSLVRNMGLDFPAVFKDRSRKRYNYHIDRMLATLNELLMLSPLEVQRAADRVESGVIRRFLTDLSIALTRDQNPGDFFVKQRRLLGKRIVEMRLAALEEAVFSSLEED